MGWDARAVAVDGAGVRSGMTAAEMVARFARLNELATADALREFADPGSPAPTLRARMVSARLADESRLLGGGRSESHADAVFDRWLRAHGMIPHRGVAWGRVSTLGPYSRLVLTLAATMRVGTRAALVRLDHDVRRVTRALEEEGCDAAFEQFHRDARAFAHPSFPRVQAGVLVSPVRGWRWNERERFSRLLNRHGLLARSGLAEDQCHVDAGAPLVIWNPRLATLPIGEAPVTVVDLRVMARS